MNSTKNTPAVAIVSHADGTQSICDLKTTPEYGRHGVPYAVVRTRRNRDYAEFLRRRCEDETAERFLQNHPTDVSYDVVDWMHNEASALRKVAENEKYVANLGCNCDAVDFAAVRVLIVEN